MNKKHILRLTTLLIAFFVTVNLSAAPKPKKEVYIPMDYSTCGYHASEKAIPAVPVSNFVVWQEGDCGCRIQQAIDEVARLKPDTRTAIEGVSCSARVSSRSAKPSVSRHPVSY